MSSPSILADIRKALARSCLAAFVRYTMPGYKMGWVHEEICSELDAFLADVVAGRSPRLMLTMPPRHGKLCADDTPVLTVDGWKTHGALKVGDYVFHPSGKPVRVVAVGEKNFATHSVVFTNGDIIDVHLDHEWRVYDRTKPGYRTVETRYFVEPSKKTKALRKLDSGIPDTRGHRYLYQVDTADAPQWPAVEHVIPPYVLGVWLGDGTSIAPRINMAPDDACVVKMEFERLGVPITGTWVHRDTGVETFSFASGVKNRRNIFSQALKDADLLKNKHIPNEYKHDSLENRLDLLAGLIDTDGHFDRKTNRYRFTTSNELLAHDVEELAMLCGFVAHTNIPALDNRERTIKNKSQVYVVSFFFSGVVVPCRLERKKVNKTFSSLRRRVSIKCVRALESPKMGNCIQVDSPDGLYLVGKHLTITHNSELASRRFPAYALGRYPDLSIISTSYAADLSSRMNRDVQRVIDSPEYRELFPGTALYGKNIRTVGNGSYLRNSDIFEVVGHAGCYRSAGVGGGITGMGAECVVIGTQIATPDGDRAIETLQVGDNVLSYNHQTGEIETDIVIAVKDRYAEESYRLRDALGRVLEVTGNHPIFSRGEYTPASSIATGDPILCLVWPGVCEAGLCGGQKYQEGDERFLLLQGTFLCPSCSQEQQDVPRLWTDHQTHRENQRGKDLPGMCRKIQEAEPGPCRASAQRKNLPYLQQALYVCPQGTRYFCQVLQQAVQRNCTLYSDVWQGESPIPSRHDSLAGTGALCAGIPTVSAFDFRQGSASLCSMWQGGNTVGGSSHGSYSDQQCCDKLDYAVQQVPQDLARHERRTVQAGHIANIARIYGTARRFVDIQVARNQNFFAGGVLVHNCAIIDDPFKDRASADSPTIRQNVWDWYTSTLYTRLAPGGGVLIINTRWHMADLSGRLLEAAARGEGDHWRVVNFPAIATEDELHRRAGEALHPERYPLEQLLAIKKALGTRDWEALYQQRPTPDGGAIFKSEWLRFWLPKDLPEQFDQLLISWDMTFKDGDDTDFVVGQVWGRKGADRYLLDQVRRRMGFTDTVAAFRALAAKWPGAARKLVEDKANGPAVIDALKHAVPGIIPVEPDGSKTARAHAVTTFFEAGNVLLPHPEHCPWAREYVAELTQFPGAPHDDQVDATTQALRDFDTKRPMCINPAILNQPRMGRRI